MAVGPTGFVPKRLRLRVERLGVFVHDHLVRKRKVRNARPYSHGAFRRAQTGDFDDRVSQLNIAGASVKHQPHVLDLAVVGVDEPLVLQGALFQVDFFLFKPRVCVD